MPETIDCLGLGMAPLDLIYPVDRFPSAGSKNNTGTISIQGGGPVPTALVTLARLGMKASLILAVGDDVFGKYLIEDLEGEGVDVSHIIKKKNRASSVASILVERESGRRTVAVNIDAEIGKSDFKLKDLPVTKIVHLDGRFMKASLKLARWARRKGIMVSLDVGSVRNDVSELLPLVDHLVVADSFAMPFTGKKSVRKAVEKLAEVCSGTIVVTAGIDGSYGYSEEGGFIRQRAFKVRTVDTTGAGDVYHGGYLFGLLKAYGLKERMEFASAAAAIKCTKPGGRNGIGSYRRVRDFLRKGPKKYA